MEKRSKIIPKLSWNTLIICSTGKRLKKKKKKKKKKKEKKKKEEIVALSAL